MTLEFLFFAIFGSLIPIGLFVGIVLFFKAVAEKDPVLKKRWHRRALWCFLGPILLFTLAGFIRGIYLGATTNIGQ